ncbi:MAG: hypothetical protein GX434_03860 [Peptococcaceae bacterium]|nr:hypothetical protein [Peptococcaceae bacterium]
MPNYKVFQDTANEMRVKIYGADSTGNDQPVLTSTSGAMNVGGTVGVSGSVAVSGPVEISGMVGVSGNVGVSGTVTLSGHTVLDSGPVNTTINSGQTGESGVVSGGVYDVLSYSSWTLAVKYSGASGDQVTVQLQTSALSGGVATNSDFVTDTTKTFTSGSWNFYTGGITPRYARLYYIDTGAASGALLTYFQAQN